MNLVLSPNTGHFQIQAPCLVRDDQDSNQDVTGIGTVTFTPGDLVKIFHQFQDQIGKKLQTWVGPDGRNATLTLMQDGTWSVWSSTNVPNLGPLRTQDDYRRQVAIMRSNGMRHEVQRG